MPSPGGQISGMGACHPDDLPEGYHADARGQSLRGVGRGCVEGCPRASAWLGVARSTGWHLAGRGKCGAAAGRGVAAALSGLSGRRDVRMSAMARRRARVGQGDSFLTFRARVSV